MFLRSFQYLSQFFQQFVLIWLLLILWIWYLSGYSVNQRFYVVDNGIFLSKESSDVTSHNFSNQTFSRFFFFRFHWCSLLTARQLHTGLINFIVKLSNDSFETVQQKFDEGISICIFLFSKVVFDPPQSFTNSDKILRTGIFSSINRMKNALHFFAYFRIGCQFIKRK